MFVSLYVYISARHSRTIHRTVMKLALTTEQICAEFHDRLKGKCAYGDEREKKTTLRFSHRLPL